jgi:hypothetical protein
MVAALGITSPAAAQFGALKKKLKASAPQATPAETAERTDHAAGNGGTIALTADVLDHLVVGLKAGQAERELAAQEDTPYGRYRRAQAAYEAAVPKCEQQREVFVQRMGTNDKLRAKYSSYVDKMVDAQSRGDTRATAAYNDSAMAMTDPSCVVKQPQRPDDYYAAERDIDNRAELRTIKASGFTRSELGQVRERVEGILSGGAMPGDPSEKEAVSARAAELKPLLGIHDAPATRAVNAAPPPAAAPAPARPAPAAPAGATAMNACMVQNIQKHEPELRALGTRAEAAQKAGNTAAMLAIADTLRRLQTAGCTGAR